MNSDDHSLIEQTIAAIAPLDGEAMQAAAARQARLTKPPGSLGSLEAISIQLAGITGRLRPALARRHVIICAGDHGVAEEGVSAYPAEVTRQMVRNFLSGGAAINVIARQNGVAVTVVDVGVAAELPAQPPLIAAKIAPGTQNMSRGPAMTEAQAIQAVATGIRVVNQIRAEQGLDLLLLGEMGIGNTTPAAAIASVLLGCPAAEVVGRGTGLDEAGLARKIEVVERALQHNQPDPANALDLLAKVGGFEIGTLVGLCLAAAALRLPILLDGYITTSAALLAASLAPATGAFFIAAHRSQERGHQAMLAHLGLRPLLDLELRLGEGTGAALAVPLLEAAVATLNEMATFEEAGVSER